MGEDDEKRGNFNAAEKKYAELHRVTGALLKRAPRNSLLFKSRYLPAVIILIQVLLGIFAVLSSTGIVPNHWGTFEWMAQLHQLTGMALLLALVYILYLTKGGKKASLVAV